MKQHSRAIACIMLTLCVGTSMGAQIASIWQQCGGTSCPSGVCQDAEWKDTKCAAGLKCFRQSEYYYQCRATAQLYEQCGGTSCQFKGVCADSNWAACTNGHSCVRKNEFYWQCLPANLAQVQSTKATTASVQSVSSAKNMRLSQSQLAHVPIPRHSVVHVSSKKPAEDAAVSVASAAAPARIRPVEEAPVHIVKQPEQVRPAAAAAVSTAAIKPAASAAAAAKPSAAAAAAKPATIGMPYSTEPTKPAVAASKVAEDTPVAIASTSSSAKAAAKPSGESKPAARIGMPYSSEPTKPAEAATVAIASAAKPSAVESKPAGAVGMPYSSDPTKPGSSSHPAAAAASISTAAVSKATRAEPSSAKKPASASAAAAHNRGGAREQDDAAELQWERPALSTASLHGEPQPAHSRPPQMMRPQTAAEEPRRARAMDFEEEDEDSQGSLVAAAAAERPAALSAPHPQASRLRPARVESMAGARDDAHPLGPHVHWKP